MKYEMEVATTTLPLRVRTGPGLNYSIVGRLPKGTKVIATEYKNGWYKHDRGGWSSGEWVKKTKDLDPNNNANSTSPAPATPPGPPPLTDAEKAEIAKLFTSADYSMEKIGNMNFILGMPHQFIPTADPRPKNSEYGRTYLDTIMTDLSMLVITPGRAKLGGTGKNQQQIQQGFISTLGTGEPGTLDEIITGKSHGRYYEFETAYTDYIHYVNSLCRLGAIYLGLGRTSAYNTSTDYKNFDWNPFWSKSPYSNEKGLFSFLGEEPSVPFYINAGQTSFNESSSNSTEQSSLVEGLSGKAQGMVKELRFLMGDAMNDTAITDASKASYDGAVRKVFNAVNFTNNAVISQMVDYGLTIVNGANVAYPEVWKDSTYGKGYNIEIRLVSPYGDRESIFTNIMVPLFHIIAFSFPRQVGRAGYMHPFLIRAFCKGWFNCNMGMVESVNIKKAAQGGWSSEGLPTEIDVSISLKDLYENLSIARATDITAMSNTEYLDFIGTTCGININKPDIGRKLTMYQAWLQNKVTDMPGDVMSKLSESVGNKLRSYLR